MDEMPIFYKAEQRFSNKTCKNIRDSVFENVERLLKTDSVPKGSSIAISAGSRGIDRIADIFKYIVEKLQKEGYAPFLFSAKGSHGGGEAKGQKELLESLGITEGYIGARISCSSETVCIGYSDVYLEGLPIFTAKEAVEADFVLAVNRIKPHTNFRGEFESGILKMLSVGMGREKGAATVHKLGNEHMPNAIKAIGTGALKKLNLLGCIAIVENAYDSTAIIEAIPASKILDREPELLKEAKNMMPSIPFKDLDLLIVQEIGKNFSGTGMDTNIIGRIRINGIPEPTEPRIKFIGVLDISPESHGNATGVGLADFTTRRLTEKIDYQKTYTNVLTSGNVMRVAIPMITENDLDLFQTAFKALKPDKVSELKIMIIKDTLHLNEFWISEGLLNNAQAHNRVNILSSPFPISFNEEHNILMN
ncbi:DUF2088 domain-containing protein [Cytobacillus oceanisediminis]|uniref:DUF2088 domain-containing protein n=1 Tax=Cytobacillus oceanisediminis TaxID=665099 RepID=UPI00119DAAF4|nr:DUF2088 domain-containing protein [Cytobacillus oceanisediminis]